ncbi:leukotriene A-4 hydrolase-like [Pogonomyrmex barbatus]|uniref:Leukotriene A-4 hydrolase-like n=1 Tax=Pogonomyrmex barbatus TaxID=144034 RepID=A0A8N1S859_9HYME|nr:leukotriene A-4 hydrolase-like [Pogonomyrmex barbatus]
MIEYVPYEKGVELLNCILDSIGGFTEFERFLKSFIRYYKYNSISSDEFKKYLYNYFPKKWKSLNSLELDKWFYQENFGFPVGKAYTDKCHILARKWLRYPSVGPLPDPNCNLKYYNDLQKIAFLSYLHESSRYLPISKIEVMSRIYSFHTCNTEIR